MLDLQLQSEPRLHITPGLFSTLFQENGSLDPGLDAPEVEMSLVLPDGPNQELQAPRVPRVPLL